jgi:probable HAF family extracellular repeat protein
MGRKLFVLLAAVFLLAAVWSPSAVHAGDPPVIIELEALWDSSSSSGKFIFDSGIVAGHSYGHAVKWQTSGKVLDLGTFGGASSGVNDVNAAGIIVGQAQDETGQYLPAVWYPNGKMGSIALVSTGYSSARAVNFSGEVAGTYRNGNDHHAFYWDGSGPVVDLGDLGSPGAFANDINDQGAVVGEAHIDNGALYPPAHAYVWTREDGMTDLGAATPDGWSAASFINNRGEIAGGVYESGGVSRAAFWTADGTLMEIGPDPAIYSYPVGLNEQGQIALGAYSSPGGYFWSMETGLLSMGSLGGIITRPQAINEQGQVVGWSRNEAGDMHAFLWTLEDGMVDLGTLGGKRSSAMGISENGLITGWSDVDPEKYPLYPYITRAVIWEVGAGGIGGGIGECPSLDELFTAVDELGLPKGFSNALIAKLEAAADSMARRGLNAAAGQLGAFINQVEAKTGKAISGNDAATLIDLATGVIDCLGSG